MIDLSSFPEGFWFGCTSSSVGAEGVAPAADWSRWVREHRAPPADEGSGFGRDFRNDLRQLAEFGLTHQRITVEWARIEPYPGQVDRDELDRYRLLFEAAVEAGIKPWATLVNGTLPGWFSEDQRGFREPSNVGGPWARHIDRVGELLGDLCVGWVPIEDPVGMALRGHMVGNRPPGISDPLIAREAVEGALAATWEAWRLLRSGDPLVMAVFGLPTLFAADDAALDERRRWEDTIWSSWIDAIAEGKVALPGRSVIEREDYIGAFDVVGVSFDHPVSVHADGSFAPYPSDGRTDGSGFVPLPEELGVVLHRVAEQLPGKDLAIGSTGVSTDDDSWRAELMSETLDQAHIALDDGIALRGLFWDTAFDGYSWLHGFEHPRGLIDRARNPKDSLLSLR